jgi:hypothetical protein
MLCDCGVLGVPAVKLRPIIEKKHSSNQIIAVLTQGSLRTPMKRLPAAFCVLAMKWGA